MRDGRRGLRTSSHKGRKVSHGLQKTSRRLKTFSRARPPATGSMWHVERGLGFAPEILWEITSIRPIPPTQPTYGVSVAGLVTGWPKSVPAGHLRLAGHAERQRRESPRRKEG